MGYELNRRRRQFMVGAIGAAISGLAMGGERSNPLSRASGLALPTRYADSATAAAFWAQPRVINVVRVRTGEERRICFYRDGQLDASGYREACHIMRDVRAGKTVAMDLRLLNLLCAMQGWLYSAYGITQPYHILSGYRSPETNANTEGAAKNSLHMRAMAIDGRLPGVPTAYIGQLMAEFQSGGVGFYLDRKNQFIHTDVGRVRYWTS